MKKKLVKQDGYVDTLFPEGSSGAVRYADYESLLVRPKIHYGRAALFVLALLLAGYIITFFFGFIFSNKFTDLLLFGLQWFWIAVIVLLVLTSRFICIFAVRLYQRYAKAEVRLRCYMTPSCSQYAIIAFRKYGTIIGGIKTIGRLRRCRYPGFVDFP